MKNKTIKQTPHTKMLHKHTTKKIKKEV